MDVDGMPLYLTVEQAAAYANIGEKAMRDMLNSACPPPYLAVGRKRMIQTAALGPYLESRQEVRLGANSR